MPLIDGIEAKVEKSTRWPDTDNAYRAGETVHLEIKLFCFNLSFSSNCNCFFVP